MLKVYGFSKVNAAARGHTRDLRVLWALEEMGLPFEIVGMDHPAHDLNSEAYRRLSPFEQIPALVDDGGLVLSESGAIVLHLAEQSGKLLPAGAAGRAQVLRWCFAALNTVEPPLLALVVLDWSADKSCGKHREFLVGWSNRALGNLDRWLAGRTYVATEAFTVADILMVHVVDCFPHADMLGQYPAVVAYRDRCVARPAWRRALEAYCARVEAG